MLMFVGRSARVPEGSDGSADFTVGIVLFTCGTGTGICGGTFANEAVDEVDDVRLGGWELVEDAREDNADCTDTGEAILIVSSWPSNASFSSS